MRIQRGRRMHHRYLRLPGIMALVVTAFLGFTRVAAQSPAASTDDAKAKKEQERALIRQVADGLKARDAAHAATPRNWKPARTPWGDPDLTGVYSNSEESGIPFEKPAEFGNRRLEDITPA